MKFFTAKEVMQFELHSQSNLAYLTCTNGDLPNCFHTAVSDDKRALLIYGERLPGEKHLEIPWGFPSSQVLVHPNREKIGLGRLNPEEYLRQACDIIGASEIALEEAKSLNPMEMKCFESYAGSEQVSKRQLEIHTNKTGKQEQGIQNSGKER